MSFIMPWDLYLIENEWIKNMGDPWDSNFTQTWAQVGDHADMDQISTKIINVKYNKWRSDNERK